MSVFVMSNRNIVIPSPDGKESVRLNRGDICQVPDWAAKTAYFKALAADGKLVVSEKPKSRSRRGREAEQGVEDKERSEAELEEENSERAGGEGE